MFFSWPPLYQLVIPACHVGQWASSCTSLVLLVLLNNKVVKNEFTVMKCEAQFLISENPPKILGSLKGGLRRVQVVMVAADVTVPKWPVDTLWEQFHIHQVVPSFSMHPGRSGRWVCWLNHTLSPLQCSPSFSGHESFLLSAWPCCPCVSWSPLSCWLCKSVVGWYFTANPLPSERGGVVVWQNTSLGKSNLYCELELKNLTQLLSSGIEIILLDIKT